MPAQHHRVRRATRRVAFALSCTLCLGHGASAQDLETGRDVAQGGADDADTLGPSPVDAAAPALARSELVAVLAERNPAVARAAAAAERARIERAGTLGVLDPVLDARLELSRARTPTEAGISAGTAVSDRYGYSATLSRQFAPGTNVSVSLAQSVERSEFPLRTGLGIGDQTIVSGPDVQTLLTVEVRQPLLRGFGRDNVLFGHLIAGRTIALREWEITRAAQDAALEAAMAYSELAYAEREVALRIRSVDRVEQQLEIAIAESEAGQIAPIEVDVVREQALGRREALLVAEIEAARAMRSLSRVLGDADDRPYATVPRAEDPPEAVYSDQMAATAAAASPALHAVEAQVDIAQATLDQARDATRPSLDASVGLTQTGLDGGWGESFRQVAAFEAPTIYGGVVLTHALRNRAARAERDAARADLNAAEFEVDEAERVLRFELRELVDALSASRARREMAAERVALAQRGLEAEQQRLASGFSTVQAGLDALERLETAELAELRADVDLEIAWWRLQHARGVLVETLQRASR